MPDSFGARLRQRREERQIALAQIAADTKIKLSLLEALERDDVSRWPSGIFRRAYIRSYAKAIGLPCDAVTREFMERFPDTEHECTAAAKNGDDANSRRRSLRGMIEAAFGARSEAAAPPAPAQPPATAIDAGPRWDENLFAPLAPVEEPAPIVSSVESPAAIPLDDAVLADCAPAEPADSAVVNDESSSPADPAPVSVGHGAAAFCPNLVAAAGVCMGIATLADAGGLDPLLAEMTAVLGAHGLMIWTWNPHANELRVVGGHGYPRRVISKLPGVPVDDGNATATAFRSGEQCSVPGDSQSNAALVAPIRSPRGSVGALAIELPAGHEQHDTIRALATVFAAQLAPLLDVTAAELDRKFA